MADEITSAGQVGQKIFADAGATRWMALVGTVMYLLEFAFIIPFWRTWPEGASPAELVQFATDGEAAISIATIGIGIAILGRVVYAAALRDALRQRPRILALADFGWALAVMAVTVEIVGLMFLAIAVRIGASGESVAVVADALQQALREGAAVPVLLAASVIIFSAALLRAPMLRQWIGWVGIIGGIAYATSMGSAFEAFTDLSNTVAPLGWAIIVIWMFSVSISLVRASSSRRA